MKNGGKDQTPIQKKIFLLRVVRAKLSSCCDPQKQLFERCSHPWLTALLSIATTVQR
jgi:hypothetical protein